jgi:hypothetical protein
MADSTERSESPTLSSGSGTGEDAGDVDGEGISASTRRIDEKKRVPKPDKQKEKKEDAEDKGDDDDDDDDCVGDCLTSIFIGMLDEICSDDEEKPAEAQMVQDPYAEGFAAFTGQVVPMDPDAEDIALWDLPGGEDFNAQVVGRLPRGTELKVLERRLIADVLWFRVEAAAELTTSGWVTAQEIAEEGPIAPGVAEEGRGLAPESGIVTTAAPSESLGTPVWQVLIDLGAGRPADQYWSDETAISDEYKGIGDGYGFRYGTRVRFSPADYFQVGFGLFQTGVDGEPQYNYKIVHSGGDTDSTRHIPTNSHLRILALELQFGAYIPINEPDWNGYVYLGAGPSVYRVREKADMDFFEFKDDNVVLEGRRTAELVRWRVGADLMMEFGLFVSGGVHLTANIGLSVIPWKAEQDKSLTMDWADEDFFTLEYLSLSIGYSFY